AKDAPGIARRTSRASTAPPPEAARTQPAPRAIQTRVLLIPPSRGARGARLPPSVRLSEEAELFDLLVEVRARHVDGARRLAHVPVVLAQFGEDVGALRPLLEL